MDPTPIIVVGSRELVWDSMADDGYLMEHLLSHGYTAESVPNIKTLFVDDSTEEDIKKSLHGICMYVKVMGIPATFYIVDDLAITYAMVICTLHGKTAGIIEDILVADLNGQFTSVFQIAGSILEEVNITRHK